MIDPGWKILAKNKAQEVLDEVGDFLKIKAPVPIKEIIEHYVGDVHIVVRTDVNFPVGASAFAQKDMNLGWLIVVNGRECVERQRFSLAHELAHIVVPINPSERVYCTNGCNAWDEKLCDQFAGDILMPENMVREIYKSNPKPFIGDVAKTFKVSWPVAQIQLKKLGLPFRLNLKAG